MRYWIAVSFLALAGSCLANDGYAGITGAGGRMRLLKNEHPGIRMVSESVRMDLYVGYYDVTARFLFRNTGKATTVTMGFPERGESDGDGGGGVQLSRFQRRTGFTRFASTVDGRAVPTRRVLADYDGGSYTALWAKRVHFSRGQTRTICVHYRADAGFAGTTDYGHYRLATYQFTGRNWKGTVRTSRLTLVNHIPGRTIFNVTQPPDEEHLIPGKQHGNTLTYTWKNWQAQGDFQIYLLTTDPRSLAWTNWRLGHPRLPASAVMTHPGPIRYVDYQPSALLHRHTPFIQLYMLHASLTWDVPDQPGVTLSWYPKRKEAVMQVGTRRVHLWPGRAVMKIDGKGMVRLPAPPFFYHPASRGERHLYVPLQPVVAALGGKADINLRRKTVAITIKAPTPRK